MNKPCQLICGNDDYLVDSAAREVVVALIPPSEREWGVEVIDGSANNGEEARQAVANTLASLKTPAMFGTQKLTWLKNATFLTGGEESSKSEAAKEAVSKLVDWIKGPKDPEERLLVTASKILRSSLLFKAFQSVGVVQDFGAEPKNPREAEKAAAQQLEHLLQRMDLSFAPSSIKNEFIKRVGGETRLMAQELEKLRLYLHPERKITLEAIRAVTCAVHDAVIWDITEGMGERNLAKAVRALRESNIAPMAVASMLEKTFSELLILRDAYEKHWILNGPSGPSWATNLSPAEAVLMNALPVNPKSITPWLLKKRISHALNYSLTELRIARHLILSLREKLVSSRLPEAFLVETTLLQIVRRPRKEPPPTRSQRPGA